MEILAALLVGERPRDLPVRHLKQVADVERTTRWPRRGASGAKKSKEGRTYEGIIRSSFLVDE